MGIEQLIESPRSVSPETLKGAAKKNWNDLIESYKQGKLAHVTKTQMFHWAQDNCGITIGMTAFRKRLDEARKHGKNTNRRA